MSAEHYKSVENYKSVEEFIAGLDAGEFDENITAELARLTDLQRDELINILIERARGRNRQPNREP